MTQKGVIIAGLSSSSGKTLTTLGLLRAFSQNNIDVSAAKTGPDYIDPGFHHAACGKPSVNLDGFAMQADLMRHLASCQGGELLIIEGVMGLYDGGDGSAVALASHLGLPVILVLDCRGQSETTAHIAAALKDRLARDGITLAGVILNRLSTTRHGDIIKQACQKLDIIVFGQLPHHQGIDMPSRHLGLVQALDLDARGALDSVLDQSAQMMHDHADLSAIQSCAQPVKPASSQQEAIAPPGQRIAVAYDAAFGFAYPHLIEAWRRQGAEISLFSPLADETPRNDADFIYLPGGYPELHLEKITQAGSFKSALIAAAEKKTPIYGECGGFMVLGKGIINSQGEYIPMLGLLDLVTSFEAPKRVLGYRRLRQINHAFPFWPEMMRGHEFHFTNAVEAKGQPLFQAADRHGHDLGIAGLVKGTVAGSYHHIIAGSE